MQPAPGMHNEDVAAAFDEMAELLAIGADLAGKIDELLRIGKLRAAAGSPHKTC